MIPQSAAAVIRQAPWRSRSSLRRRRMSTNRWRRTARLALIAIRELRICFLRAVKRAFIAIGTRVLASTGSLGRGGKNFDKYVRSSYAGRMCEVCSIVATGRQCSAHLAKATPVNPGSLWIILCSIETWRDAGRRGRACPSSQGPWRPLGAPHNSTGGCP